MKVILCLLLFAIILAIPTYTFEVYYKKKKDFLNKLPEFKKKLKKRNEALKRELTTSKKDIEEYLILDSKVKWKRWLFLFAFSYLLLMESLDIQTKNQLFVTFTAFMFFILLVGIGQFIHASESVPIPSYIMKLVIFLVIPLLFLEVFLQNISRIDILLLTNLVSLSYSVLFVKSVIDMFKNYIFQFLNFVLILVFFNLIIIGFTFGAFYYENNDTYNYFTEVEIERLNEDTSHSEDSFDYQGFFTVVTKGMEPFFNFPSEIEIEYGMKYFVPMIEYFIGNVYLLLVVGFFVSYSVGMLVNRKGS